MSYNLESYITIGILLSLTLIYLYLLLSPSQPRVPMRNKNFVIERDTLENFNKFLEIHKYSDFPLGDDKGMSENENEKSNDQEDDFFLNVNNINWQIPESIYEPNVPSSEFYCISAWVTMMSEVNYRYLWMHSESQYLAASATMDTPIHKKSFKMTPVSSNCTQSGWVLLQPGDSNSFIYMVPPGGDDSSSSWVIKSGTNNSDEALLDSNYHFLFEKGGYVLNRGTMGFLNTLLDDVGSIRGHSTGLNSSRPAGREYGAQFIYTFKESPKIEKSWLKEKEEIKQDEIDDAELIKKIQTFPKSSEKRVISFGLYGSSPKYTQGALRNVELAPIYFPGWICRFYVTQDVPESIVKELKAKGAEVESIPPGTGYVSGMFWRFMVASDPTVDRYIIRDSDSRLNARDRLAVEEWIKLNYPVHIIRDHVNHCIPMNGGMWGGTKAAIPKMKEKILDWSSRDEYTADLQFLEAEIWPEVKHIQIAHDSYCCDRFPNAKPFPSKRPLSYQHVGQVFDADNNPRLTDIEGFIRGVPTPLSCRKHSDWIYG